MLGGSLGPQVCQRSASTALAVMRRVRYVELGTSVRSGCPVMSLMLSGEWDSLVDGTVTAIIYT